MSLELLLVLLVVGLAVGFISGLVGIGGGVLIVPFLYFFYAHPAFSRTSLNADLHTVAAHATSLFIIVPTAALGTWNYARRGLVEWRAVLPVAIISMFAAIAGVRLALVLPPQIVRVAFGLFLITTAVQLFRRPNVVEERPLRLNAAIAGATGVAVGVLSGLMGIGGGAIAGPLLLKLAHLELRKVAATSLAIVGLAALSGAAGYIVSGLHNAAMPPGSLGYIHVTAGLPIMVGSMIAVRLGTKVNQRMNPLGLRVTFAVFFGLMGIYFIAQNLPVVA